MLIPGQESKRQNGPPLGAAAGCFDLGFEHNGSHLPIFSPKILLVNVE